MKRFLAGVFLFGFVVSLVIHHVVSLRPFIGAISIAGAAGASLPYLIIGTLILRPWRKRQDLAIDRPPYRAAAIAVGIWACCVLIGSLPS